MFGAQYYNLVHDQLAANGPLRVEQPDYQLSVLVAGCIQLPASTSVHGSFCAQTQNILTKVHKNID